MLKVPLFLLLHLVVPGLGLRAHNKSPSRVSLKRRGRSAIRAAEPTAVPTPKPERTTCAPLENHATHFTVKIQVGTPPQEFHVVADTGSDSVLVTSCICLKSDKTQCPKTNCFRGSNHSSTFTIPGLEGVMALSIGERGNPNVSVPMVEMSFASGKVQAIIASDIVRVGRVSASMDGGLLLITQQELVGVPGPFDGILGLGLPRLGSSSQSLLELSSATSQTRRARSAWFRPKESRKMSVKMGQLKKGVKAEPKKDSDKMVQLTNGTEVVEDEQVVETRKRIKFVSEQIEAAKKDPALKEEQEQAESHLARLRELLRIRETQVELGRKSSEEHNQTLPHAARNGTQIAAGQFFPAKSFLESAGVSRFSMCLNLGSAGVLRLGSPKDPAALGSIGKVHWALELNGISFGKNNMTSLGGENTSMVLCDPSGARQGQSSACGAILDSGTTTLMGPMEHMKILFSAICDNWKRCRASAAQASKRPKWEVFQIEMTLCSEWIDKEGLQDLPPLRFTLRGSQGTDKVLEIPAKHYVLTTMEEELQKVNKPLFGLFSKKKVNYKKTGKQVKRCIPAFGALDYPTQTNGPAWVLGMPIFYAYQVGYDLKSKPPSISFSEEPCGSCPSQTSLFSLNSEIHGIAPPQVARNASEAPAHISGPVRVGNFDTSLPL